MAADKRDRSHSNEAKFVLTDKRSKAVVSRVQTLKLDRAEGAQFNVPKDELVIESTDANGKTVRKYRYRNAVAVPVLNAALCVDKASLMAEFDALVDNIDAYDSAGVLVNQATGKEGRRKMRVAMAADDKTELSTYAYLASEINGAITLAAQKRMYKPLQARARVEAYANHTDVVPPAKGERIAKDETTTGNAIDDAMDE